MEEIYVAAHADWNADGTPDIAAVPVGTHALLLEGEPNGHHWLEVLPKGTVSNRDAIGTKVTAFTTDSTGGVIQRVRQLACGEGMLAQYSRWLHFGLGNTTTIDSLEIRWPLGDVDMLYGVAADQRLVLTEGAIGPDCTDLATYDPAACGCRQISMPTASSEWRTSSCCSVPTGARQATAWPISMRMASRGPTTSSSSSPHSAPRASRIESEAASAQDVGRGAMPLRAWDRS